MSAYAFLPYHLAPGRALAPLHAVLEITHRCNLRCQMCYQDASFKSGTDPLGTGDWKKIIDQIPARTIVTLTGGEPTLRGDFRELAGHAFRKHRCHLNTNGTRLDDRLAEFIIKGRFAIVGVSIDGDRESHDTIRGSQGAFEKAWAGVERLIFYKRKYKQSWPLLDLKTMLLPHSLAGVAKLVERVAASGLDLITFHFPKISNLQHSPCLQDQLRPFYASCPPPQGFKVEEITGYCADWEEKLQAGGVSWRYYPRMFSHRQFAHYFSQESLQNRYLPCYVPWVAISVSNHGEVYPCLSFRYGKLGKESLAEIWNGSRAREFRHALKERILLPQCEGCCWLRVKPASGQKRLLPHNA